MCSRHSFVAPDTSDWQTGDIFFSAGNSWRSVVVKMFNGENPDRVTHIGFVVIEDGRPMLVHMSTEKEQVTKEGVEEYARINDVSSIIVRRLKTLPDTVALRKNIYSRLASKKEFDDVFDIKDTTKFYCTEFVIRELQRVNCHVFDTLLTRDYVYPIDLAISAAVATCGAEKEKQEQRAGHEQRYRKASD